MKKLRILLLQARDAGDPVREEEALSFARFSGLERSQVATHDLLEGPPVLAEVRRHDALMIGGAGDYYVSRGTLPHQESTLELLGEVAETRHPAFASCFGFQCLVAALGGEVVYDAERTEVGTYSLDLTGEGRDDPLLGILPPTFPAQLGRKDRADRLPPGISNLAASERCPFQAFRVPGRPVWATQFHPELDGTENRRRFFRYLDGYEKVMTSEERRATELRFAESPHTAQLLPRFLELVFG